MCPRCSGTGTYKRFLCEETKCSLCNGTGTLEDACQCPDGQHIWIVQRRGGAPDDIDSDEWIEFCWECGKERTEDDE